MVRDVASVGLRLVADDNPPRHADIAGWPTEKDATMSAAQQLASSSTFVAYERPKQAP